jgi:hypothetical protein
MQTIQDVLRPQPRFFRSVSLKQDLQDPAAIDTYVVTPWLRSLIDRFLSCAEADSTRRAWRMYRRFRRRQVGACAGACPLSRPENPRNARRRWPLRTRTLSRLFPVVILGSRGSLGDILADGVQDALAATTELTSSHRTARHCWTCYALTRPRAAGS